MRNSAEIQQSIPLDVFFKTRRAGRLLERARRLSQPKPDHATKGALPGVVPLLDDRTDRRNDIREKVARVQMQEALSRPIYEALEEITIFDPATTEDS